MIHKSDLHPENQWFDKEPPSPLKTAVELLWDFARLHGLCMDLCGKDCCLEIMRAVADLKYQAVLKDAEIERQKEMLS